MCTCRTLQKCIGRRLSGIATGDETWIHFFESQKKIDNRMWLTKKAKCPATCMAKRYQSSKKLLYAIFLNSEDMVVQVAIPKGWSITGHVYRNYVLKKVMTRKSASLKIVNFMVGCACVGVGLY